MKSIIRSIGKSMGKKASKQALPPEDAKLSVKGKENGFEPTKNGSYPASISSVSSAVNGSTSSYRNSAEQDSAINELLEGRMKLTVNIVHRNEQVVISVERRTPLLDLLVSIGTQFHFNPSNYVIQVDEDGSAPNASSREYKASTPIGILDASKVSVVSKPEKVPNKISYNRQQSAPSELPFKPTIRLQVNLPHNQMMVLRLMPSTELAEIKDMICKEKSFEAGKYLLVKPFKPGQSPMVLELDKSLEFYHINEVTILANKTYQELSKQFSSSNRNQFSASMYDEGSNRLGDQNDLSQSTPNIAKMNGMYKRSVAESNSDLTSIHRSESSSRTGRLYKNKPAPPPPLKAAKSVQNLAPIRDEDERPASEIYTSYEHNDSSSLSEHSTTTEGSKPADVITVQPKRGLSRHNSGSDSSGYHEMLSHTEADTPTDSNSPAPPLSLSPHPSESFSDCSKTPLVTKPPVPCQRTSLNKTTKAPAPPTPGSLSSTNSAAKKRRAPLPPSSGGESNKLDSNVESKRVSVAVELSEPIDTSVHNVESPILVESEPNSVAMSTEIASTSEASSSSSSAFVEEPDHSLNNQSLSPIVIIKTSQSDSTSSSSLLDGSDTKTPMNSTMIPSISEKSSVQEVQPKPQPLFIPEETSESPEQLQPMVSIAETIAPVTPATPLSSPSLSPPPSPQSSPPIATELAEIVAEVEKNSSPSVNNVSSGDLSATEQYTNNGQVETVVEAGDVANGGDVNQHYGTTTAIQTKPRLSTLGHDRKLSHSQSVNEKQSVPLVALARKTSSTLNSYRKVLEQASPDPSSDHHHHFHQHSEDEICACEQFASNYNRIRSQFSHFEDQQHIKSTLPCSSSTLAKLNSEKLAENIEESTKVEEVQEETIYPTRSIEQTCADSNDSLSTQQPIEVGSGDLGVNSDSSQLQESAPEAGDLEMNSSLKRPSVVTISEWKTPKDTDILLVNSQSSSNGLNGPTKFHSSLDRNLEKQVEVTLNEFNETLDRLDDSVSPSPLRKEIPNSTFVPHITVENSQNGHSKINITSNNGINGQALPKSISSNSDQSRAKVVVGSMKDSSPSTNSTSNPNVSTTPTKSVRDNILKFSAASSLSNRTSVSHQDLPSLRSLPATPSGTLRRSSSKIVANNNGPIPEVESPQVTRKLANFRIGSFKKELDIFEHPQHPQANSIKPTIVTAAFKQSTTKPTANGVSSINDTVNVPTTNINVTKSTPTVISVNGTTATQSNGTNALPKESAKKVFNSSNVTTPAVVTNGGSGRTFLQELKSRTWSYRTGLSQFSEQDEHNEESNHKTDISKSNVNNVKRFNVAQGNIFPSKTNVSTNGYQSDNTNKAPLANGHHTASPLPIETKQLIPNSSTNINQSESKPAVVPSPNIPLPPPPPPPPPMAPIDSSLANRPLSPEFAQTNTLLAPTGWKPLKATEPKQIRSPLRSQSVTTTTSNGPKSPVSSADPHDALLNEIRNFQNKSKLKKVTNNEPFSLAVHGSARMQDRN